MTTNINNGETGAVVRNKLNNAINELNTGLKVGVDLTQDNSDKPSLANAQNYFYSEDEQGLFTKTLIAHNGVAESCPQYFLQNDNLSSFSACVGGSNISSNNFPEAMNNSFFIFNFNTSNAPIIIKSDDSIVFKYINEYADEAAATTAGLEQGTLYKTPTGELRIKL